MLEGALGNGDKLIVAMLSKTTSAACPGRPPVVGQLLSYECWSSVNESKENPRRCPLLVARYMFLICVCAP